MGFEKTQCNPLVIKERYVDISPKILDLAKTNITSRGLGDKIRLIESDITIYASFTTELKFKILDNINIF